MDGICRIPKRMWGGKLIAIVRGPEGNIFGLIEMPHEMKHP
jgi:hypothetical protein